jgi:predicted DNA-binding transcriptional regulator YafY
LRLRRRATASRPGRDGWDELTVPYGDLEVLAEEVAGFGADVEALDPPELRQAVVRRLRGVVDIGAAAGGAA